MKAFLTIPETCVWAATRSSKAVDDMTARAREGIHALLGPEDAALSDYPSAWETLKALDDLCADGALTMHGIERGTGGSGPIPTDAWAKLALVTTTRWGLVAARRGRDVLDPESRWWNDLTIRSADALRVWPPREADNAASAAPSPPKRRSGAKPSKLDATMAYIRNTYPGGCIPHSVKNESIAAAVGVHEKTVRRAVIEMGQNTDR